MDERKKENDAFLSRARSSERQQEVRKGRRLAIDRLSAFSGTSPTRPLPAGLG